MVPGITSKLAKVLIVEGISTADMVAVEAVIALVATDEEDGCAAWIEGVEDADGRTCLDAKFSHAGMARAMDLGGMRILESNAALAEGSDDMEAGVSITRIQGRPPVAKLMGQLNGDGHAGKRAEATSTKGGQRQVSSALPPPASAPSSVRFAHQLVEPDVELGDDADQHVQADSEFVPLDP